MITLTAPKEYKELTKEQKKEICNGCGSKGGIKVPGTFYGLDISEACDIHDFMYYQGETWEDKVYADMIFENNLHAIIEEKTWFKWLKKLRMIRAAEYVIAVKLWGDEAYMTGKGLKPKDVG